MNHLTGPAHFLERDIENIRNVRRYVRESDPQAQLMDVLCAIYGHRFTRDQISSAIWIMGARTDKEAADAINAKLGLQ